MKAKVGITVFFEYDGFYFERDIEDVHVYKNYSWYGNLGFGGDVQFLIHGNLDENNVPIMEALCIQVDGVDNGIHEYIREGITWEDNTKD